ncbi:hypothetical protein VB773_22595 [Haloarculaceae archaeon H-GB2-1]|nr:hypothetical protein [Haloarculaceae archaeon H-GB2-1]
MLIDVEALPSGVDPAQESAILDVLSDRRMQYLVWRVGHAETPIERDPLAAALAAWYRDELGKESADEHQMAVMLHHVLLPKLEDADLIDRTPAGISPTQLTEQVVPVLRGRFDGGSYDRNDGGTS